MAERWHPGVKARHVLSVLAAVVTSCAIILTPIWLVAEPHVKGYVELVVAEGNYAKSTDVKRLESAVKENNQRLKKVEEGQRTNERKIDAASRQLRTIEQLTRDNNQFMRDYIMRRPN